MEQPSSNYEAGLSLYNEEKPEGDRDLVKEIRTVFSEAGVSDEGLKRNYDANRHIQRAEKQISAVQKVQIARYTDILLKTSPKNTLDLRSEILTNGSVDSWVGQFRDKIAPFVATDRLLEK